MGYFPFYIDIENKSCVVVGGGIVALRKIERLLPFKPCITVIAPKVCDEIAKISEVKIENREFKDSDIDSAFMVISATDNQMLNAHIFELCKDKNILINTVDDKDKCGFIFPALVKKENVTVGISTSGKSPLYARYLRERLESEIGEKSDKTVEILSYYRGLIKNEIKSEQNRKNAFEQILKICIDDVDNIDENQILNIIEDNK
jgi:siroheme synthase-like protein